MNEVGIYIHIPFCVQKCYYCDFVSFANMQGVQRKYIEALKKEITYFKLKNNKIQIKTVYIGGGTPSYIDSKIICEVLDILDVKNNKLEEITIEMNPGTVTKEKLLDYRKAGINRLSIGLQSTNNHLLKQIGRIHNYGEFVNTYKLSRNIGFDNINVDLMIGLPNQKIKDIKASLESLIKLENGAPEHISVYSLILEDGTVLKKLINEQKLKLPSEDLERNMYWYVKDYLELNGYKHYEISNFAKKGYESKHNLDCWNQCEYIGFGVNASSYFNKKRYSNICEINNYIENIEKDSFCDNIIVHEIQNKQIQMKEYMLLGLRKIDGISVTQFENKFNENPIMLFRNELDKLSKENLVLVDGDKIKLSNKGLNLANIVWEEFV